MAQDWQVPDDAICPDEPTCMYCGKICNITEVVYTDDDSYRVSSAGAGAMTAKKTCFIK